MAATTEREATPTGAERIDEVRAGARRVDAVADLRDGRGQRLAASGAVCGSVGPASVVFNYVGSCR